MGLLRRLTRKGSPRRCTRKSSPRRVDSPRTPWPRTTSLPGAGGFPSPGRARIGPGRVSLPERLEAWRQGIIPAALGSVPGGCVPRLRDARMSRPKLRVFRMSVTLAGQPGFGLPHFRRGRLSVSGPVLIRASPLARIRACPYSGFGNPGGLGTSRCARAAARSGLLSFPCGPAGPLQPTPGGARSFEPGSTSGKQGNFRKSPRFSSRTQADASEKRRGAVTIRWKNPESCERRWKIR